MIAGVQLQKSPYPFVGPKMKTWAKLSRCSFLSLMFLMLSLLWQKRLTFFLQKMQKPSIYNFLHEPAHIAESAQKKTPKAVTKQNRGSLLPLLFICNSDTCISRSADTRNLRSRHITSFLYSYGFKPPPLILIFTPSWLCCKQYSLSCKAHSLVSFHLFSRSEIYL